MAQDKNRWADYNATELFWDRIRKRYDKKLDYVTNHDDSIKVVQKNRIAVQISEAEKNLLQLKTEYGKNGLYVPTAHKLTFGAGEAYVYDGTEDVTVPVYTGDYE